MWCAMAGFTLVLYATMANDTTPYEDLPLQGAVLAGVTIAMAAPLGWARRRPTASPVCASGSLR